MIRCENCGHKLMDGQKVCDICKKPVVSNNVEDLELEEQLARSIAQIVESETADANAYYKQVNKDVLGVSQRSSGNNTSSSTPRTTGGNSSSGSRPTGTNNGRPATSGSRPTSSSRPAGTNNGRPATSGSRPTSSSRPTGTNNGKSASGSNNTRPSSGNRPNNVNRPANGNRPNSKSSNKNTKGRAGKIALIIVSSLFVILMLVGLAFYTINMLFVKSRDTFTYYNNTGVTYVQSSQYSEAIPYLEKALTFDEAKERVNIRFTLYDCYVATGNTEKAIAMLYNILQIEPYNLEAIVNLETYYEKANVTEALKELYNKYKDTQAAAVVAKYYVESPKVSVPGGEYTNDVDLLINSQYAFPIYYTLDGTEPTSSSYRYNGAITIKEGTTILKYVSINEYGIASDVSAETYVVKYSAPSRATINPASGSYTTEQLIVIGNIPAGGEAYYTLDNTTPNKKSTLYEGPFDMPEGNTVLSVIVYDKNGLASSVTRRNYVLEKEERISKDEAMAFIWDTMIQKEMVNEEHISGDGEPVELVFDAKRLIEGSNIWTFNIIVKKSSGDEKLNYQMGVGCETGYVYTVYENYGIYKLDAVNY